MADDAAAPEPGLSESSRKDDDSAQAALGAAAEGGSPPSGEAPASPAKWRISAELPALTAGLLAVVVLAGLVGWLGFRAYQAHNAEVQRGMFLQTARKCAVNFTTFDYQHVDADVQRILDSATGKFYDDFSRRSRSFIDVVKQARSSSVGAVTEAGVESQQGDEAQVLVAVRVQASKPGSDSGRAEEPPEGWRMRITVRQAAGQPKVSNLAFVS